MRILFYSTKEYEKPYIQKANTANYDIIFTDKTLSVETAALAKGFECISIFTNDDASALVIEKLFFYGVKHIAIRATGYNNVDIDIANDAGIKVANVPSYSAYSVAEHALCLMLASVRKLITAHKQVQQQNFSLENLIGYTLHNKTIGVIGTGAIGSILCKLLSGFGCNILAYDIQPNTMVQHNYSVEYTNLENLCNKADIISIHLPLNEATKYIINKEMINRMRKGVVIINTARGAIVNTNDIIECLENEQIGFYGMDVYENEQGIFFNNHENTVIQDKQLLTLMRMPNVIITPHQAFATSEALENIANITLFNINCWVNNVICRNERTLNKD
jgi:D-lactate dehydrogenase